jgi:hypothetical protein
VNEEHHVNLKKGALSWIQGNKKSHQLLQTLSTQTLKKHIKRQKFEDEHLSILSERCLSYLTGDNRSSWKNNRFTQQE